MPQICGRDMVAQARAKKLSLLLDTTDNLWTVTASIILGIEFIKALGDSNNHKANYYINYNDDEVGLKLFQGQRMFGQN